MYKSFLVLGAGSAGLLAALTLKRKLPQASVRVVRSPEIGVIGVGESTTPNVPFHLFNYLGINQQKFYALAEPTWKLGIRFLWGPRPYFNYSFEPQMDSRIPELHRPNGYYCQEDCSYINTHSALMSQGKAFVRQPNGAGPVFSTHNAFHVENPKLVKALEMVTAEAGIEIMDGKMEHAERGAVGIEAIILEDGRRLAAEFFIDASGFRSELLGRTLQEPHISYGSSLFNDRAILGNWERTDEPILPYTTSETMDAGWSWRIEHEHAINRGYVYCSQFISDEEAKAELLRKNPKAKVADRVIKFSSGRYQRAWAENVMAIGNACGFVEPLEATSLMVVCWQCQTFVELLDYVGDSQTVRELFNKAWSGTWEEIRDFLALHFRVNTRLDTPYWQHCRNETDVSHFAALSKFYQENGPSGFARYFLEKTGSQFGIEGFLTILVGNAVPYEQKYCPSLAEQQIFNQRRSQVKTQAKSGVDVKEALACIRHPSWRWR